MIWFITGSTIGKVYGTRAILSCPKVADLERYCDFWGMPFTSLNLKDIDLDLATTVINDDLCYNIKIERIPVI